MCVCVCVCVQAHVSTCMHTISCIQLFGTPWTAGPQAPLSMGFSRQADWSGLPFPSPGDLPDSGNASMSLTLADSLPLHHLGSTYIYIFFFFFLIVVYYKILNIVPWAIQLGLIVYLLIFYIQQCVSVNSKFLIYLPIHLSSLATIRENSCFCHLFL